MITAAFLLAAVIIDVICLHLVMITTTMITDYLAALALTLTLSLILTK